MEALLVNASILVSNLGVLCIRVLTPHTLMQVNSDRKATHFSFPELPGSTLLCIKGSQI